MTRFFIQATLLACAVNAGEDLVAIFTSEGWRGVRWMTAGGRPEDVSVNGRKKKKKKKKKKQKKKTENAWVVY
jgi:hypothetical protein